MFIGNPKEQQSHRYIVPVSCHSKQQGRTTLVTRPLWNFILDIQYSCTIKDVTRGTKGIRYLVAMKIKECWKGKPHATTFIRNQRTAVSTRHFAGKHSCPFTKLTIVKLDMFFSFCESNVVFVKNGGPLHGCAMKLLTVATVTNFRVDWIIAHLIFHSSTMTRRCILDTKVFVSSILRTESFTAMESTDCRMPCGGGGGRRMFSNTKRVPPTGKCSFPFNKV